MLGGAGALAFGAILFNPALLMSPLYDKLMLGLVLGGISMEAGALAGALTANRGTNITTRQAAAFRQIIYGEQRIGGNIVYRSTTGSHHDQYNYVIVIAGHECDSLVNLYLDGRQVFWKGGVGNVTRNGVNFGGAADGNTHIGPDGQHYNFGTLVYCEAKFGDQARGDVIAGLTANDPNWAAGASGSPYLGGCTYVYLKIEYDTAMFNGQEPEIRFTVRGKNNIYDPRTGTTGYTNNWALIVADVLTDTQFGLGDTGSVNAAQLIAAANVCDESVALAKGGTEKRYTCNWHYDNSTTPGDALQTMMPAAAGRLSRIGGEWYVWPAYWQGPSFSWDENSLVGEISWTPTRSFRDLFNRVNGTYIAPNYPYNDAGNLYDSNGWYYGQIQNNFPFAFQPTNYPQYACDVLHGYPADQYLAEDGIQLPREIGQPCVLSVAQSQRVAKIMLLRNRQQGSGSLQMSIAAMRMQPCDVMLQTFKAYGWNQKQLEINSFSFQADTSEDAPRLYGVFGVNETSQTVYEWSATEELTVYDVPASPSQVPYQPAAPGNVVATSTAATSVVGADGITIPRIEVLWDTPQDLDVTQVQLQLITNGVPSDAGNAAATSNLAFISGVIVGQTYGIRIRSLRNSGAVSDWVEADGILVSALPSQFASASSTARGTVQLAAGVTSPMLAMVASTGKYTDLTGTPKTYTATSGSLGGSAIAQGSSVTMDVSVPGATVGSAVAVSASDGSSVPDGFVLSASVTAANTVTVKLYAAQAGTPDAKSYNVRTSA